MSILLNGEPPLGYRIGTSDRPLGDTTASPDGFIVLNLTNGNTFEASGGFWISGGTFPAYLYDAWLATIPGVAVNGYRVDTLDRTDQIGQSTASPEGFFVINSTTNTVLQVVSGVWTDVTLSLDPTTLADILAAWAAA